MVLAAVAVRAGTLVGEDAEPDCAATLRVGLIDLVAARLRAAGESGERPVVAAAARGPVGPWVAAEFTWRVRSRPAVRRPVDPDFEDWLASADASWPEVEPVSAAAIPNPADIAPIPKAVASTPTRPMKREGFAATRCGLRCVAADVSRRLCGFMTYSLSLSVMSVTHFAAWQKFHICCPAGTREAHTFARASQNTPVDKVRTCP